MNLPPYTFAVVFYGDAVEVGSTKAYANELDRRGTVYY
jgi:hypothetical protein